MCAPAAVKVSSQTPPGNSTRDPRNSDATTSLQLSTDLQRRRSRPTTHAALHTLREPLALTPPERASGPVRAPRPRAVRGGCAAASGVLRESRSAPKAKRERRRLLEITKSRNHRDRRGEKKGGSWHVTGGYTRGVHAIGIFRLIPVWVRFNRRGESGSKGAAVDASNDSI